MHGGDAKARSVLLATGVKDRQPVIEDHDRAVALGLIRYCAICDGYEASGRNIAVLGDGDKAAGEALFSQNLFRERYTRTRRQPVVFYDRHDVEVEEIRIPILHCHPTRIAHDQSSICLGVDGVELRFDCLCAALGSEPLSGFASVLGAAISDGACIIVDKHQSTQMEGVVRCRRCCPGSRSNICCYGAGCSGRHRHA